MSCHVNITGITCEAKSSHCVYASVNAFLLCGSRCYTLRKADENIAGIAENVRARISTTAAATIVTRQFHVDRIDT